MEPISQKETGEPEPRLHPDRDPKYVEFEHKAKLDEVWAEAKEKVFWRTGRPF